MRSSHALIVMAALGVSAGIAASEPGIHFVPIDQMYVDPAGLAEMQAQVQKVQAGELIESPVDSLLDIDGVRAGTKGRRMMPPDVLQAPGYLSVKIVAADHPAFEGAKLAGGFPAGTPKTPVGPMAKGWTGVTRFFTEHPRFGTVVLDESDVEAEGGTTLVPLEMVNADVNGNPAILSKMTSREGRTLTNLTWYTAQGKQYTLQVKQVDAQVRNDLLAMAQALSE